MAQLSVCRLLAGLGGSAGMSIFGGILADIWDIKGRVKASGLITTGMSVAPGLTLFVSSTDLIESSAPFSVLSVVGGCLSELHGAGLVGFR